MGREGTAIRGQGSSFARCGLDHEAAIIKSLKSASRMDTIAFNENPLPHFNG